METENASQGANSHCICGGPCGLCEVFLPLPSPRDLALLSVNCPFAIPLTGIELCLSQ